ncbi:hypothetical protein BDN70DRAFT_885864 [Pholiota conissans]|uniref:Secreted protein n=1 Tax=Pholiota conissans TaxID=109636 RepID=A0A9P5YQT2_9AGAR|nr:hypothetical protein BDN70DRAFT_885864 [Pholiota conissans]
MASVANVTFHLLVGASLGPALSTHTTTTIHLPACCHIIATRQRVCFWLAHLHYSCTLPSCHRRSVYELMRSTSEARTHHQRNNIPSKRTMSAAYAVLCGVETHCSGWLPYPQLSTSGYRYGLVGVRVRRGS